MSFGNGPSAGPKILAVDDEEFNLDLMEHHLGRAGYHVVRAEDGTLALQKLEEEPDIDLIVLDRMMPNLGGMEVLRQIKADARFQDIPVVMQTAAAAPDQVSEGIKAGAYYYLTKPYKGTTLVGIVRAALDDARTKTRLKEKACACTQGLGLMEEARFRFQTVEDAAGLASYVSNCFPDPQSVVIGLHELPLNAVEHGNLGITYSEKTNLVRNASWNEEIERRLALPEYCKNFATLTFKATEGALTVYIKDAGRGFDWKNYLDFSADRATDPHGRGIATSRALSFQSLEYLGTGNEVRCTVTLNP
jgi:CheY-like chemotaxis protein